MIYFIYFYSLEMWTGISIPVHIFESRAEVVYRELRREKRLGGTSILSTAVRGSAFKNLLAACVQSRTGTAGKRWKKESPKRGSYYRTDGGFGCTLGGGLGRGAVSTLEGE